MGDENAGEAGKLLACGWDENLRRQLALLVWCHSRQLLPGCQQCQQVAATALPPLGCLRQYHQHCREGGRARQPPT